MLGKRDYRIKCKLFRMPQPRNDAEFAILTEWYFGEPLSLTYLRVNYYEIAGVFDEYVRKTLAFSDPLCPGYGTPGALPDFVFGEQWAIKEYRMSLKGGTPRGHRHAKRLQMWVDDRNNIKRGSKGSPPRKSFERLAERTGARREQAEAGLGLS